MNLNKVFILGNLTRDPEVRTTPSGQQVATFSIATNRVWYNQNKEKNQKVEFHNVVVWGKLAEIASQYLTKGKMALVEGRIETRSWQAQDGTKKYRTEIIAEKLQLGPKTQGSAGGYKPESQDNSTQESAIPEAEEAPMAMDSDEMKTDEVPF